MTLNISKFAGRLECPSVMGLSVYVIRFRFYEFGRIPQKWYDGSSHCIYQMENDFDFSHYQWHSLWLLEYCAIFQASQTVTLLFPFGNLQECCEEYFELCNINICQQTFNLYICLLIVKCGLLVSFLIHNYNHSYHYVIKCHCISSTDVLITVLRFLLGSPGFDDTPVVALGHVKTPYHMPLWAPFSFFLGSVFLLQPDPSPGLYITLLHSHFLFSNILNLGENLICSSWNPKIQVWKCISYWNMI